MRNGMLGASLAIALALGVSQGNAADMPADVWSWTGFYIGTHTSVVSSDREADVDIDDGPEFDHEQDPTGVAGGAYGGVNYQFDDFQPLGLGALVLGVEGDFTWGDIDDTTDALGIFPVRTEVEWMASARARIGLARGRVLAYITGGVAFANLETEVSLGLFGGGDEDDEKNDHIGWTIGTGIEYAITDSLVLRSEFLYADFKDEDYDYFGGDVESEVDLKTYTFRVGAAWKF
jgi:outer membrane immunogenic protein